MVTGGWLAPCALTRASQNRSKSTRDARLHRRRLGGYCNPVTRRRANSGSWVALRAGCKALATYPGVPCRTEAAGVQIGRRGGPLAKQGNEQGNGPSASELLGDWRAAGRDAVAARDAADTARRAVQAASRADEAAVDMHDAAKVAVEAAHRMRDAATVARKA